MNDSELIEHLGGSTKVAELLGYDKAGGVQRVQNWLVRGIPAQVKVDHPKIFMRDWADRTPERRKVDLEAEPVEGMKLVNRRVNQAPALDKQEG